MRKTETTNGVGREHAYTYDPQAGRFISADPRQFEPAPLQAMRLVEWGFQSGNPAPADGIRKQVRDWQGRTFDPQDLNRFSYVLNNPLNRVDVDGYGFWKSLWKAIRPFVGIVMSLVISVAASWIISTYLGGLLNFASAAGLNTPSGSAFMYGASTAGGTGYSSALGVPLQRNSNFSKHNLFLIRAIKGAAFGIIPGGLSTQSLYQIGFSKWAWTASVASNSAANAYMGGRVGSDTILKSAGIGALFGATIVNSNNSIFQLSIGETVSALTPVNINIGTLVGESIAMIGESAASEALVPEVHDAASKADEDAGKRYQNP